MSSGESSELPPNPFESGALLNWSMIRLPSRPKLGGTDPQSPPALGDLGGDAGFQVVSLYFDSATPNQEPKESLKLLSAQGKHLKANMCLGQFRTKILLLPG